MSTILLTGSSGFIGQALVRRLMAEGHRLRLPLRSPPDGHLPGAETFHFDGLEAPTNWTEPLHGVDIVIHCAGRVPAMDESPMDMIDEYRRCNVDGTVRLASNAAHAGARRFVFVSAIAVCGEHSLPGQPFSVTSEPAPASSYAISKLEAERALFALTASSSMEIVIVRPPLVYGPGVKGVFLRLMEWLDRGKSLPLAGLDNRHALVSRSNLVDLLVRCTHHPAAAGHILHASDGRDLGVTDLLERLGNALGKPPRFYRLPGWLLKSSASLSGRGVLIDRLRPPLEIDIGHDPPAQLGSAL